MSLLDLDSIAYSNEYDLKSHFTTSILHLIYLTNDVDKIMNIIRNWTNDRFYVNVITGKIGIGLRILPIQPELIELRYRDLTINCHTSCPHVVNIEYNDQLKSISQWKEVMKIVLNSRSPPRRTLYPAQYPITSANINDPDEFEKKLIDIIAEGDRFILYGRPIYELDMVVETIKSHYLTKIFNPWDWRIADMNGKRIMIEDETILKFNELAKVIFLVDGNMDDINRWGILDSTKLEFKVVKIARPKADKSKHTFIEM